MTTETAQAATSETPQEAPDVPSDKEQIYIKIGEWVKERTGKRIGKTGGRELFDLVVEQIFTRATASSTFRFNGGFGPMHVRTYQAGERRLPSGAVTTFGERQKIRYEEGIVVEALVANKGNLEEALKARGSRAPREDQPASAGPADEVALS